ncbi:Antitoxin MazE [compost metagenome]
MFELDLEVDVRVEGNRMIIELVRPPIDLDAMLTAITPENSHELIDWGPPVGKEVW